MKLVLSYFGYYGYRSLKYFNNDFNETSIIILYSGGCSRFQRLSAGQCEENSQCKRKDVREDMDNPQMVMIVHDSVLMVFCVLVTALSIMLYEKGKRDKE